MFYTEKSMNGIITLSDGQGVEISGGDIESATIHTDNIQAINPADDVYLFTNSTGTIYTGFNNTFSSNNLQGTSITSNITLFTNTTSGNIDLGTGLLSTATNTVGNSVCKNKIGNVVITDKTFSTPNTTDSVSLFNNIVSGNITLGTGGTSGSITIGTTNTTDLFLSNLNIRGSEIYGRAVSATCGLFDNITTGIINIGSGLLSGGALNIALGTAGSIIIGGSGNINLGQNITTNAVSIGQNGVTTSGGLKLYSPITLGYTSFTAPNSVQIGWRSGNISSVTGNVNMPTSNVINNYSTFSVPTGVWFVEISLIQISVIAGSYVNLYLSTASLSTSGFVCYMSTSGSSNPSMSISTTITNTSASATTRWLCVTCGPNNFVMGQGSVYLTRIA
jgi:hypothetical protein